MYNLPSSYEEFDTEIARLNSECSSCKEIKDQTTERIVKSLTALANPHDDNDFSYVKELKMRVLREKNIYNEFNKLKLRDNIFYGKLWIPREHEGKVKMTLDLLSKK
jgi:vacuolar-type H+-ATPase subunit I/STV1